MTGQAPDAETSIRFIRSLTDDQLIEGARTWGGATADLVMADAGSTDFNRDWIRARCAETAFDRGLIDSQEFDWLTR